MGERISIDFNLGNDIMALLAAEDRDMRAKFELETLGFTDVDMSEDRKDVLEDVTLETVIDSVKQHYCLTPSALLTAINTCMQDVASAR